MASLNYKSGNEWKKVIGGKTGVLTFNGRAGVVTPKEGDYTAEMVGAISADDKAVPNGIATLGEDGKLLDIQIPGLDKLGAAPAGYGLGGIAKTYPVSTYPALSEFIVTGWYRYQHSVSDNPYPQYGGLLHVEACDLFVLQTVHIQDVLAGAAYSASATRKKLASESVFSEWEWISPPMITGSEYRTIEKYRGVPVYTKVINCGTVTAGSTHIENFSQHVPGVIIRYSGQYGNVPLPFFPYGTYGENSQYSITISFDYDDAYINTYPSFSDDINPVYVQVWYVK